MVREYTLDPEASAITSPSLLKKTLSSHTASLYCIGIVAFLLAVTGLDHGLPDFPDVDELTKVQAASRIANTFHPSPGWFGHPGSTIIYPLALIYRFWGSAVDGIPLWQINPELHALLSESWFAATRSETAWVPYYMIGRWLNVFYFIAGIILTYVVGVQVWDKRVALTASWLMAILPILIQHAQVVRTDHAGIVFLLIAFLACFRLLRSSRWQDYLYAGVAIGIAGSSRYFNLSLGAVLILTHFLRGAGISRGGWKLLAIGTLSIAVGFNITTPAFLASLLLQRAAWHNLIYEARGTLLPMPYYEKLWWYISSAFSDALSWPVYLFGLVGALSVSLGRDKKPLLLLAGTIVFLGTISVPTLYRQRWLIPIIPIILLFAAKAFWMIVAQTETLQIPSQWRRLIPIVMLCSLSILPLSNSLQHAYLMTQPDTRNLAREWIELTIPPNAKIAREMYTPFVPGEVFDVTYTKFLYELGPLDSNLAESYDYLIASSDSYDRYYRAIDENQAAVEKPLQFYNALFAQEPIAEFRSEPWRTPGPTIRIYRISR